MNQDHPQAMLESAIRLHAAGRLDEAEPLYREVLAANPVQPDALNLLGMVAYQRGKAAEGLPLIERAIRSLPGESSYRNNHGLVLDALGRYQDAIASYLKAIELRPDFGDAASNLGTTLMHQRNPCEAAKCYRHALLCDPNHPVASQKLPLADRLCEGDNAARRSILAHAPGGEKAVPPVLRQQTQTFTYVVEVAEACNLRCPSCPQGNLREAGRAGGLIEVDLFRRILDKIRRESPVSHPALWLFSWGEPFLHPQLPELVRLAKAEGLYVMLSTNLNIGRNLEEVLAARPDEIKISLSGASQQVYGATHARGDAAKVRENLRRLKEAEDRVRSGAHVWAGFHLYRHNLAEHREMGAFIRSLGFGFNTQVATVQPAEKMIELLDGKLPQRDKAFLDRYLIFDPAEGVRIRKRYLAEGMDCEARYNMMSIGHDGLVDLCCNAFHPMNRLGLNFLDTPHAELQAAKYRHPFCAECYGHGLQMQPLPDEAVQAIFRAEDDAIAREAKAQNVEWQ